MDSLSLNVFLKMFQNYTRSLVSKSNKVCAIEKCWSFQWRDGSAIEGLHGFSEFGSRHSEQLSLPPHTLEPIHR